MGDVKNLISAVVLSMLVLFAYQTFYLGPLEEEAAQQALLEAEALGEETLALGDTTIPDPDTGELAAPEVQAAAPETITTEPVERIVINATRLSGSISPVGARLDDLVLNDYFDRLGEGAENIELLKNEARSNAYFAEFNWRANTGVTLPTSKTVWTTRGGSLTTNGEVELYWENGQGITFRQFFSVDENFMFTIRQVVENNSDQRINIAPIGEVRRIDTPETQGFFILYEGPLGVFNGTLEDDDDYDDLADDGSVDFAVSPNGWLGYSDKYWLTALVPDQTRPFTARFQHQKILGRDAYTIRYLVDQGEVVAIGGSSEYVSHFFAGAKEVSLIDAYEETYNIPLFDRAIDWGWFYFLTKPIFYTLDYFYVMFGNFGVSILILTVIIKLFLFPLANKSFRAMSRVKKLQPKVAAIKERFPDDKLRQQQETMALYKREKANPASGCLPMFIQIPVFFALYKTLFVTIEMRHEPFFGWVHDLAAPDPMTFITLFGLVPWDPPGFLLVGIWPILMGVTMWFQMKLNPQSPDPIQAKIFTYMPIVFTFILAPFPVGLVIYWTWNNILTILQQYVIMKKEGVPIGNA
ncbi:MAG: membrane protein insertase YidC [Alphaproteobacteria bacterium]|nr:MAG: membrane protein insertase YidC [Alphaproteobacteria bacterium]